MAEIYITVVENEGDELVELPLEEDHTLSLGTLQGQFPGACGLKYRSPETGAWRGLRVTNDVVSQINNDWSGNHCYVVVYPKDNKRKGEEGESDQSTADGPKTKRLNAKPKTVTPVDLIVMNLPFKLEEDAMRAYFETFGEPVMVQLKKDLEGKSRGFGFIRYKTLEDQGRCLAERHYIEGRQLEVKLPQSKTSGLDDLTYPGSPQPHLSRRIFVGRVTENITKEDLETYFVKYGEITDVFVPKPFRMFAFVTFAEAESAAALIDLGEDHLIKGCSVNVAFASPMKPNEKSQGRNPSARGNQQQWPGGKVPENPMEAMGMAMAMMNTYYESDAKKKGGRGGRQQSGYSSAMNPSWNTGYQGGYGSQGGYGAQGGYGTQGGYGFGGGSW